MSKLKTLALTFLFLLGLPTLASECFENLLEFHKTSVRERLVALKNKQIERMKTDEVYADDFKVNQVYTGRQDRKYKIIRKLGEGQEGAAYLVSHNKKRYVLKDFFKAYKFSKYSYELDRSRILDRINLIEPSDSDDEMYHLIKAYKNFLKSKDKKISDFLSREEVKELTEYVHDEASQMAKMNLNSLQGLKNEGHPTVDVFSDETQNGILILEYVDGLSVKEILEDRVLARELKIKARFDELFDKVSSLKDDDLFSDVDPYKDPLNNFDDFEEFLYEDDTPFESIYDVSVGVGNSGAHLIPDNVFYDFKTGELIILDPN